MTELHDENKSDKMPGGVSRRDFLRTGGVVAVAGTVGLLAGTQMMRGPAAGASTGIGKKYAMVIDLSRCTGCRACVQACKVENNTPEGVTWMYVFKHETGEFPRVKHSYLPRPCQHCDNAPCVKACPVGARYKRDDGLVAQDRDRCVGCRYCQVACPYSVNYFNWKDPKKLQYYDWAGSEGDHVRELTGGANPPYSNPDLALTYGKDERHIAGSALVKGVMGKCTFCVHRLEKGLLPACVSNCPVKTYTFGDLNDPESDVSKLLYNELSFRLAEEHGTKPSVYYIGGSPPDKESRELDPIVGVI